MEEKDFDIVLPCREEMEKAASDYAASDYAASQRTEMCDAVAVEHFKAGMRAFRVMMMDLTMEAATDIRISVHRRQR